MKISKTYEEWVLDWQSYEDSWEDYFASLRERAQKWFIFYQNINNKRDERRT